MQEMLDTVKESDHLSNVEVERFYAYAFAQYRCGCMERAEEVFQVLCARRPLEPRFWFGLAAALQEEKKFDGALRAWAMAALLESENPYPHFHAAECSFSTGNFNDARLALKEAEVRSETDHPLTERITLLKEIWKL